MARATTMERRFVSTEVEVRHHGGKPVIEGYAAVFGKRSQDLGGFVEVVETSAFNKTVKEADVRALLNHDANFVLGRNRSGTLKLAVDNHGLHYEVDPPNTQYARDLMELMERGDVNQSSFSFFKIHDRWALTEDEFPERSLMEVSLVDVSPVTYPAYLDATSGVSRSAALDELAKRSGYNITDLADPEAIRSAIKKSTEERTAPAAESTGRDAAKWLARQRFAADMERIIRFDSE